MFAASPQEKAYLAPFVAFMLLLGLGEVVMSIGAGQALWILSQPRYWIVPLQTVVCGVVLARYWRVYEWRLPAKPLFTVAMAVLVFALWIAPQELFGLAERRDGFDPWFFGGGGPGVANTAVRFVRLVIIVPLVEEIFWRGFRLRYMIADDFLKVPIGTFSWKSFGIVAVLFMLAHSAPDYPAALVTGALYNVVAYRTRSLSSCVLAHAITNLLLGIYVMRTGQWGFW